MYAYGRYHLCCSSDSCLQLGHIEERAVRSLKYDIPKPGGVRTSCSSSRRPTRSHRRAKTKTKTKTRAAGCSWSSTGTTGRGIFGQELWPVLRVKVMVLRNERVQRISADAVLQAGVERTLVTALQWRWRRRTITILILAADLWKPLTRTTCATST